MALREGALYEAAETAELALEVARRTGTPSLYAQGCIARALALQGRHNEAQKLVEEEGLDGDWQAANVYLEIGDRDKAKRHALLAYMKAWAEGPPHIFWWELERSKQILAQLGVPEPELPLFDPAKIKPIPFETEIRSAIKELNVEKSKTKEKETRPPISWQDGWAVKREQVPVGFIIGLFLAFLFLLWLLAPDGS